MARKKTGPQTAAGREAEERAAPVCVLRAEVAAHRAALLAACRAVDAEDLRAALKEFDAYVSDSQ